MKREETGSRSGRSSCRPQAAALIAYGFPDAEVARQLQLGKNTITTWRREPNFLRAIEAIETETLDRVSRVLVGARLSAVVVLSSIMKDMNTNSGIRVRAAAALLNARDPRLPLAPTDHREDAEFKSYDPTTASPEQMRRFLQIYAGDGSGGHGDEARVDSEDAGPVVARRKPRAR